MSNIKPLLLVLLAALALLAVITNPSVVNEGNFVLGPDERTGGSLVVRSGNVSLEPGSSVGGSLYVLCCHVAVEGEVHGSVHLVTGNLDLGETAVVHGNVAASSANVAQAAGAVVDGTRTGVGVGLWLMLVRTFCLLPLVIVAGLVCLVLWLLRRRRSTAIRPATPTME